MATSSHSSPCLTKTANGGALSAATCGGNSSRVDADPTRPVRSCCSNSTSAADFRFRARQRSPKSVTRSSPARCGAPPTISVLSISWSSPRTPAKSSTCKVSLQSEQRSGLPELELRDRPSPRATLSVDRDRPNTYVQVVEFPSYEAAMANSALPETSHFAEQMTDLSEAPFVFRNVDVRSTSWRSSPAVFLGGPRAARASGCVAPLARVGGQAHRGDA